MSPERRLFFGHTPAEKPNSPELPTATESDKESNTAHIFPGQGSQFVGMGEILYNQSSAVRKIYDITDKESGIPISTISFKGPEEELNKTTVTQLAVLAHNEACRIFAKEQGQEGFQLKPKYLAGHSLGFYNALVAAEALTYPQAVKAVKSRGEAMTYAHASNPGRLIIIRGLDRSDRRYGELTSFMRSFDLPISAYNAKDQIVIGMPDDPRIIEQFEGLCSSQRIKASSLKTAGMFHTKAMEPAVEPFGQTISALDMQDAKIPIIANRSGRPIQKREALLREAKMQLTQPVRWSKGVSRMKRDGITQFVEIGNCRGILINMDTEVTKENVQQVKFSTERGGYSGILIWRRTTQLQT